MSDERIQVSQPCDDLIMVEWGPDDGHRLWMTLEEARQVAEMLIVLLAEGE